MPNSTAERERVLDQLTANRSGAPTRWESLEGRKWLVVPMVMLTEGVHKGSNGAFYYPPEELAKTPESWNHKPVVVYHPTANGKPVSACTPESLETRKIGIILNTRFEEGKLKAEAWLDPARTKAVDERVAKAIDEGKMMELSTGVFSDHDDVTGNWSGPAGAEEYIGIARNYRPDHLAVLPDRKGACSMADGAGFLRNQSPEDGANETEEDRIARLVSSYLTSNGFPGVKEMTQKKLTEKVDSLIANEKTAFDEKDRDWLSNLTEEQVDKLAPAETPESEEDADGDEPNAGGGKKDDKKGGKGGKKAPTAPAPSSSPQKQAAQPASLEEYLDTVPETFRPVILQGIESYEAEKADLIANIKSNPACPWGDEELEVMGNDSLRKIQAVAAPPKPEPRRATYAGAAGAPTHNRETEGPDGGRLSAPRLTFGSKN